MVWKPGKLQSYKTEDLDDVCDVTLSVYPHRASLKNIPGHGGNRTYDLWNTSPMLCQLSCAVRSVLVSDISEQNLVPPQTSYSPEYTTPTQKKKEDLN